MQETQPTRKIISKFVKKQTKYINYSIEICNFRCEILVNQPVRLTVSNVTFS